VRRPMLHTLNLADLLPLTSIWPGLECNPCPAYPKGSPSLLYAATAGATPFRLNLHVSDVGHTLILGPTGSGKSTLVGLLMAQFFRYPGAQVFLFEIGHLMNLGERNLVPILLYLFRRVERQLRAERPSLLIIEEAWITALNSVFGQKVEEWLRTLRKKNTAVIFVSQSLADVVGSIRRDIILESCPTKIFLPNPEAENEQAKRLYQSIGLNSRQIRMLAMAIPKRQYYYTSSL